MKEKALSLWDRAMLSRRFIIETINIQLKNISQIEYSRHRSPNGFMLILLTGLVAYCLKENKPTLILAHVERNTMVSASLDQRLIIKNKTHFLNKFTSPLTCLNW
ncbi:MAG: hypothetical protein ACI9YP_001554 [Colwellia sp.]|jgi:hypothetical protein